MGILDWAFNKIADGLAARLVSVTAQNEAGIKARSYRMGHQKRQLKVAPTQFDDNISLNFTGLISNRIVSSVLGEGIEFRIDGDENEAAQEWLDMFWDANHKEILLHRGVMSASECGTGYILINPKEAGVAGEDGTIYPRLILVDPLFVTIDTLPEDWEIVVRYNIEYKFTGVDGKEHARRRVIENDPETGRWEVVDYESAQVTGNRWVEVNRMTWAYTWPPIIHWQSNPSTDSQYGEPDISGSFEALQDRVNFVASNVSKIIRLYAHPQTIAQDLELPLLIDPNTGKQTSVVDIGPDKMLRVNSSGEKAGSVYNLAQLNDLTSSLNYLTMLRQSLFDTTRVVDVHGIEYQNITNFGLSVLYQDQIAMTGIKRELLGDALEEINRRVLEMNGMPGIKTEVIWPETVPVNMTEKATYYQTLAAMQVVDKQTIAEELGLNWETIQERMDEEKKGEDNLGELLLRSFNRGGNDQFAQRPPVAQGKQQVAPVEEPLTGENSS
jgi:hypothetical protein